MGADLETVRAEVEKQVGTGPGQQNDRRTFPTRRARRKSWSWPVRRPESLNHTYIGTEHILLGLLREGDGVAARVLGNLGLDLEKTRQEILKELDPF